MGFCNLKLISFLLVCLLSLNFVFALGVSSPYWKDYPLKMYPGETRDVEFTLVNKIDADTASAYVIMVEDAEISQITSGTVYTVEPGSKDQKIVLSISVPETAIVGETYDIGFSVKGAAEVEGTVQLSVGYNIDFPVEVIEKPEKPLPVTPPSEDGAIGTGLTAGIIVGIVVILIIIFVVLGKRKSQSV